MNKNISKYIVVAIIAFAALSFSCNHQTIFYQIEQETELKEAELNGNCTSVLEFNNKIYCCNGKIYAKDANQMEGWKAVAKPAGYITKLAASNTTLYALNDKDKIFMTTDGTTWTQVDTSAVYSVTTIFCDGAGNAYLKGKASKGADDSYFELSSGTISETNSVSSWCVVKNGSVLYTANGETVKDSLGGKVTDLDTIYAITYSTTDNAVYAGTGKGLVKLPVDDNGKLTGQKIDPPGGNFSSTIKNYQVLSVLATSDALYCGIAEITSTYPHVKGLWSYYFEKRPSWNRE